MIFCGGRDLKPGGYGIFIAPPMGACRGHGFRVPLFFAIFLDDPHPSNSPRGLAPHSRRFPEGPLLWRTSVALVTSYTLISLLSRSCRGHNSGGEIVISSTLLLFVVRCRLLFLDRSFHWLFGYRRLFHWLCRRLARDQNCCPVGRCATLRNLCRGSVG